MALDNLARMIKRVGNKIKRLKREFSLGFNPSIIEHIRLNKNFILMYHGVDLKGSTTFNTRHTSLKCFEKQISFLKKHTNIISTEDFFQGKFNSGKSNVAITFDDGYKNNYQYALPVLERYQVFASFFVTGLNTLPEKILWADFIDIAAHFYDGEQIEIEGILYRKVNNKFQQASGKILNHVIKTEHADYSFKAAVYNSFGKELMKKIKQEETLKDYWELMSDEEIIRTGKSKWVKIGSHGYLHNNLGVIELENARKELMDSKSYLENLVQYEIDSIAYPDGSYTRDLIDSANDLGFNYQYAAGKYLFEEDKQDNRILNRAGVYTCDTCYNQLFYALNAYEL